MSLHALLPLVAVICLYYNGPEVRAVPGVVIPALRPLVAVLQWARSEGCPWDEMTCSWAAAGGHLSVLQWAISEGCPWDSYTCSESAGGGHLSVLQWTRIHGCPWDFESIYDAAEVIG